MNGNELRVVLGASGGIGSALVRELVSRGYRVRAVNRGGDAEVPKGSMEATVERAKGDVTTPEGAKAAVAGASVVYHAAQPDYTKWPEEFPPMTNAIIEGVASAGAKLVFADNLYMYGPSPQPMTEETPQRATSRKGKTRILMAGKLLEAHRSGKVRTTMGRASDYYGPRGTGSLAGDTLFGAAIEGKTLRWPASLDVPHQFNYLPDIARALVTLGERDEADGEAWHLPAAEPVTGRRLTEMVLAETGIPTKAATFSRSMTHVIGIFVPPLREFPEIWYQYDRPFWADVSKFQQTFGPFGPTSHEEAVRQTVEWFRRRKERSTA